jgi:hypothetical protein
MLKPILKTKYFLECTDKFKAMWEIVLKYDKIYYRTIVTKTTWWRHYETE